MHDFIYNISLGRKLTGSLAYWDIKAVIGMKRLDMASRLLEENDSILSATQKEELVAMIQKM